MRGTLRGQYLRLLLLLFCLPQVELYKTSLIVVAFSGMSAWACVTGDVCATGPMTRPLRRCGCGGNPAFLTICLSNNLPLVHFEFWLQPTTPVLFLSHNFLFGFIFLASWGRSGPERLFHVVRPHTCTFTENLMATM